MCRIFTLISCLALTYYGVAQNKADTALRHFQDTHFYNVSDSSNHTLLLFLHGGLNNPYFDRPADQITLSYLLEDNQHFVQQALSKGFDLILPVTNGQLNWLEQPDQSFLKIRDYIASLPKEYQEIYICGFSDGATGSYKIFYQNPGYFSGLVLFNGYPQHRNFYKNVDYSSVTNKKVVFYGTFKDKVIPYEFMLSEYCLQKVNNANTYFYLTKGDHTFASYGAEDLDLLFDILNDSVNNVSREPLQGLVRNDTLVTLYPFRKMILRKYNFGKETYLQNVAQQKKYKK